MSYIDHVLATRPANLLAYWPLNEASGTVADNAEGTATRDGTFARDVSTMGTGPGIGDGNTAPLFTPGSDYCNIYSSSLNSVYNGGSLTLLVWDRVRASSVWTDSTIRWPVGIISDTSNQIFVQKTTAANQLQVARYGGGTSEFVTHNSYSPTDWVCHVLTVSQTADEFKYFEDGSQFGSTQTTLGAYVNPLNSVLCNIGVRANTTFSNPWDGYVAHVAVWDVPLTPSEIAQLYIARTSSFQDTESSDSTESGGVTTTTTTYIRKYIQISTDYKRVVVLE